jgi:SAM-dependent methyltransferase
MKYAQFDYHPSETRGHDNDMITWWEDHWEGRNDLRHDLYNEPSWATIEAILSQPGNLLEAGCALGHWVRFLNNLGHRAIGIDFAFKALKAGKTVDKDLLLVCGDLRSLPFHDESFDYIVSFGAVEHDINGPHAALKEFHRLIKPSGSLMCAVPCLNIERTLFIGWYILKNWLKKLEILRRLAKKTDPFKFYEYIYSPGSYKNILLECGFRVVSLRPYGYPVKGKFRYLLGKQISRLFKFYNPHMMMAICRKEQVSQK